MAADCNWCIPRTLKLPATRYYQFLAVRSPLPAKLVPARTLDAVQIQTAWQSAERLREMAETATPAFLVELPKHVPGWDSRARSSRDGRAVAISGPRKQRGATLRGCELSAEGGCLFEGEKDALVFYPPLELAATATIAVELKPRTLTRDERWLVATFGKGVKGESAHICLLQTEGQQLLGLWDGDQEQWHACEPECDIAPKGHQFVRIVAQIEQSQTSYYVDGVLVGCAAHAVHAPVLGAGNVPLCDRPKSSSRKQVVGWMKRF